jgi:hypothetical protein
MYSSRHFLAGRCDFCFCQREVFNVEPSAIVVDSMTAEIFL